METKLYTLAGTSVDLDNVKTYRFACGNPKERVARAFEAMSARSA